MEIVAGQTAHLALSGLATGRIEGTVRDAATHAPKPDVYCGARAGDHYAGGRSDDTGALVIKDVVVGPTIVTCDRDRTEHAVVVVAGETAHLDIDVAAPKKVRIGMELEERGKQLFVRSVEPDGVAARAGVAVGDRLVEYSVASGVSAAMIVNVLEDALSYQPFPLELERAGKQITVTLAP